MTKSRVISNEIYMSKFLGHELVGIFYLLIASVATLLAPIKDMVIIVIALVLFDTATGILASRKLGKVFKSGTFGRVIVKLFYYVGLLVLLSLCANEYGLPPTVATALLHVVLVLILTKEMVSIDENGYVLTGMRFWPSIQKYFKINNNNGKKTNN